jgi:hypothetical protein
MKTPALFTSHPRSVGETYGEHLRSATGFGLTMLFAGLACLLHGVFPFLFERTGSNAIGRLYERMVVNRMRGVSARRSSQGQAPIGMKDPIAARE